ncbi:MAG: hypothetical protein IPQ07_26960 [Myxococcales bacterium]|nr:hypothetical protein [Myxococcales bacterium]
MISRAVVLVGAIVALGALGALGSLETVAWASPWKPTRGTLEPGRLAGSFVLSSDAAPGRYSEGAMITSEPVALPYTLEATWRRLGPEAGRSMHVLVAGGVVLIKSGAIAFYAYDDAAFAQGEWRPLAGHQAQAEHVIAVQQDPHRVIVKLDGAEVARYELEVVRPNAHLGFGMKAAPGLRSSILVRAITIATTTDHLQ